MSEKASVGRLVRYWCTAQERYDDNNGAEVAPAIVVRVGRQGANLQVFFDGPTNTVRDTYRTNVPYADEDPDGNGYCWTWPPRD